MGRVDIYRLETGQTYRQIRSSRETDLLDYIHDRNSRTPRVYLMPRPAIMPKVPPPELQSWDDLEGYEPPKGQRAATREMVVVHGDDGIALGAGDPLNKGERQKLLNEVDLVAIQRAQARSTKESAAGAMEKALVLLAGSVALVTVVIALLAVGGYLQSDDTATGTDGQNPTEDAQVAPPPTPTPAPPWQNPRPSPTDNEASAVLGLALPISVILRSKRRRRQLHIRWVCRNMLRRLRQRIRELRKRWRERRAARAIPRETLVVYDTPLMTVYRVSLPIAELYDHLGPHTRYVCPSLAPYVGGAALGGIGVLLALSGAFWWLWGSIVLAVTLALVPAFCAAGAGWLMGPKLIKFEPHWLSVRNKDGEVVPFDISQYLAPDDPEASFTAEVLKMDDFVKTFTTEKGGGRTFVQLGSVGLMLVCGLIVLFLVLAVVGG